MLGRVVSMRVAASPPDNLAMSVRMRSPLSFTRSRAAVVATDGNSTRPAIPSQRSAIVTLVVRRVECSRLLATKP